MTSNDGFIFLIFVSGWITITIMYMTPIDPSDRFDDVPTLNFVSNAKLNYVYQFDGHRDNEDAINDTYSSVDAMKTLINVITKSNLLEEIFITDPIILYSMLTDGDQKALFNNRYLTLNNIKSYSKIRRKLSDAESDAENFIATFGVIYNQENAQKLINFCSYFEKFSLNMNNNSFCRSYLVNKFIGYDDLVNIYSEDKFISEIHLILNGKYFKINVFHKVNDQKSNVLWTANADAKFNMLDASTNMDTIHQYMDTSDVIEEIYEHISLTKGNIKFGVDYIIDINFPSNIFNFLSQIESARLIHCNTSTAISLLSHRRPDKETDALISLIDMKTLSQTLKFPFMFSSGSHLGWYRECGANSYTNDADYITYDKEFANANFKRLIMKETLGKRKKFKILYIFGNFSHGFEMSFISTKSKLSWKSDLFFLSHDLLRNASFISSHVPSSHTFYYYYYPLLDQLCSGFFLNHKVNVPCAPLDMIIPDYGDGWRVPIESKNWNYAASGNNIGPEMKWDPRTPQMERFNGY